MDQHCLNCGQTLEGKFCANCGQKATTQPITLRAIVQQMVQGVTNLDKGFLYTLTRLTYAPGPLITNYLRGQRVQVYNPFQYALIGVSLLILVDVTFGAEMSLNAGDSIANMDKYQAGYAFGKFVKMYLKFLWFANVLFFAFATSLFFRRFNFAEHLTINAFVVGHTAFLVLPFYLFVDIRFVFHFYIYLAVLIMYIAIFGKRHYWFETGVYSLFAVIIGYILFFVGSFACYSLIKFVF